VPQVQAPRPRFIDKTGATVFEHDFRIVSSFQHGLAVATVHRHERQGFIDRTGAIVIEPRFKDVRNFGLLSSGVAVVMEKRRIFHIDRNGDRVGNQAFTQMYHVNSCDDTWFCVFDGGKWGFVNCRGEFELPPVHCRHMISSRFGRSRRGSQRPPPLALFDVAQSGSAERRRYSDPLANVVLQIL